MKMEIIDSYRPVSISTSFQSFDATKFIKRLKEEEKIGWWQHFLNSIEETRNEIRRDLLAYRSAESAR